MKHGPRVFIPLAYITHIFLRSQSYYSDAAILHSETD